MWARYSDPDRSDTAVGIRLQLSSSDEGRHVGAPQQHSSGAAGDTDSESHLTVAPLRRLYYQQQRPANPEDSVSAILDRASVLLSQHPHTFSLLDSSEPEEATATAGAAATPTGVVDREFFRIRAAVCHGHMQAGRSAKSIQPPRPPPPPPPPPQPLGRATPLDAKSAASCLTRHFFESTFLTSLPVAAAKEASASSPTEVCTPLKAPVADSATVGLAERPLCAVFRCSGPDRPLRPPPIVQRTPPRLECRESRTAACQTDTVDLHQTGSVASQTDDANSAELDSPEPLPHQQPPEPLEDPRLKSSTALRCRSVGHSNPRRPSDRPLERRLRRPPQIGDQLTSEQEPEDEEEQREQLQPRLELQRQERQRQQELERQERRDHREQRQRLREGPLNDRETAEEAGVLRTVGRRLNAFFCPGGGCCGTSPAQAAAAAAATAAGTSASSSSARISGESVNNWQQAEPWEPRGGGRTAKASAQRSVQQWVRQSETVRPLIGDSPSLNAILEDSTEDSSDEEAGTQRPSGRRVQRSRRRSSQETNTNSRHSSRQRRGQRCNPALDKRSMKSSASALATAETKTGNGGGGDFDCLLQTLDRAARRRRLVSSHGKAPSSPTSSRRCKQRQPPQPSRVERCSFHICEVTCELGSPGIAACTDADDDQDEMLADDEEKATAGIRLDGNQSNADGGCYEQSFVCDLTDSFAEGSSASRRTMRQPKPKPRSEDELLCSIAQSLVALSRDLQLCVSTIEGTVTELQRCGDSD